MKFRTALFAAATLIAATSSAGAQTLIDQAKVMAGNVTSGDGAGFPVTISQPGSYKLTSNLMVPAGFNGIEITADNVSIDLNGFAIIGAGKCVRNSSSYDVSCTSQGRGIITMASSLHTMVRNGMVNGFYTGVLIESGQIQDLSLRHNNVGIATNNSAGEPVLISGTTAALNNIAIQMTAGTVERSVLMGNRVGLAGNTASIATIVDSQVTANQYGVMNAATARNRILVNKTDTYQTTAF